MAKIYETTEDVERDALSKKVEAFRNSRSIFGLGFISTFNMWLMSREITELGQAVSSSLSMGDRFQKCLGWAYGALAVACAATGFMAHRSLKNAEKKLDALGSEEIHLPGSISAQPDSLAALPSKTEQVAYINEGRIASGQKVEKSL